MYIFTGSSEIYVYYCDIDMKFNARLYPTTLSEGLTS